MGKEIERKFLVRNSNWKINARPTGFVQGYLNLDPERTVRVRIAGNMGFITVKGKRTGLIRSEYEYIIPPADAAFMLENLCIQPLIEKNRYQVEYHGMVWEVDEFFGVNSGLVLAEIELKHEDQAFSLPDWVGREVSDDARYCNSSLVSNPWNTWGDRSGQEADRGEK